jgi:two-component system sensor histidine kinase GlrK
LQDEGRLHRTAWELDVGMRHGQLACAHGEPAPRVRPDLEQRLSALASAQEKMGLTTPLSETVDGYVRLGTRALTGDVCSNLLAESIQTRRTELDEQLTNFWVARLEELHRAVREKEGDARSMSVAATWAGLPLALMSVVVAVLVARRMARVVSDPLEHFARLAARVGKGDFGSPIHVEGPREIVALAEQLERMREQLGQLEALKQGFLASVSHELRTPLSKIREALALLQDGALGELDERKARVVQIARVACEREIRMVTTLLDLSRLRAGSPLRLRDLASIDQVIEAALNDERSDATARGVTLELSLDDEAPNCSIDPILLERALANLIRNAVSVSSSGDRVHVSRAVENAKPPDAGLIVRFSVGDQGPGVPHEIRERIFEPFVTESVSGADRALGVGIGLALAREVARAHGGDLTLAETGPRGTRFELRIPVLASKELSRKNAASLGIDRLIPS